MTLTTALLAPYPYKGTLGPADAARAMADGVRRFSTLIGTHALPLADGGSGTLDALIDARGGEIHTLTVPDAAGRRRSCRWGMTGSGDALVEAAEVIALASLPSASRHPASLTTRGVGLLILEALGRRPSSLAIGLGDTATHDCGLGIGALLGYRFLDEYGRGLPPVGASLPRLTTIDASSVHRPDSAIPIHVYCDVLNPLVGPDGAALRFAGQKGANRATIELLELGGGMFLDAVERDLGVRVGDLPGAGAAGGLGAGLVAFLGGRLEGGADAVLAAAGFDRALADADLVITGEGRLDSKTMLGKGVGRIAQLTAEAGKKLLIVVGRVEGDSAEWEGRLGGTIVELGPVDPTISQMENLAEGVRRGMERIAAGT